MEAEIIEKTIKALEKNNFEVFFAQNRDEAREVFFNTIFPEIKPTCVSWGDSMTMKATGVLEEIEKRTDCVFIQTLGDHYTAAQKTYWRRKALEADLFLSGTNALTQQGQLVNADMIAPLNAIRHTNLRTPCQKTNTCMDCQSPDRLCNTWVITEKSFPAKRVKIILINEPLGL